MQISHTAPGPHPPTESPRARYQASQGPGAPSPLELSQRAYLPASPSPSCRNHRDSFWPTVPLLPPPPDQPWSSPGGPHRLVRPLLLGTVGDTLPLHWPLSPDLPASTPEQGVSLSPGELGERREEHTAAHGGATLPQDTEQAQNKAELEPPSLAGDSGGPV